MQFISKRFEKINISASFWFLFLFISFLGEYLKYNLSFLQCLHYFRSEGKSYNTFLLYLFFNRRLLSILRGDAQIGATGPRKFRIRSSRAVILPHQTPKGAQILHFRSGQTRVTFLEKRWNAFMDLKQDIIYDIFESIIKETWHAFLKLPHSDGYPSMSVFRLDSIIRCQKLIIL